MYAQNGDVVCAQLNGVGTTSGDYFANKHDHLRTNSPRDVEMLRLIGQYLCDKGLNGAYAQLSKESGISLEHIDATELRHATLEGRWNDAEAAVDRLVPLIGDPESTEEVRFLLLEQRFLEHLEANEIMPAVTLLRNRITPMQRNIERVHTLASCLMCRTSAELRAQAGGWAGKDQGSRLQLIDRIQTFVPAQTMLPPRRLEELIDDSVRTQLSSCIFHNPPLGTAMDFDSISLLQRHSCGMQNFPAFCIQTLHQRDSELWLCQFSPDGTYLAVGGRDANVDVLRVDIARHTVSRFRVLNTPSYINCLCWSPDSKKLAASCGEDQSTMCVFEVLTGQQLCSQKVNDEDTYSSACFFADSRKLAFGGLKGVFYVMDTEDQGRVLTSVEGYRVQSMAAILSPLMSITPHVGSDEAKVSSDPTAPGGPDTVLDGGNGTFAMDSTGSPTQTATPTGPVDQLLVADSLHRIRLFRFGTVGGTGTGQALPTSTEAGGDTLATPVDVPVTTGMSNPSLSTRAGTPPISSSPADLTIYLTSGGAPGSPGSGIALSTGTISSSGVSTITTATGTDNPSIAAALTVARLSGQQQRLLQQSTTTSSTTQSLWQQHPYHNQPSSHTLSLAQTSSSSTISPSILFDMPILPVSLTRFGSSQTSSQHQTHSSLRPAPLHHSGSSIGGTPYTVVSSSSGSNLSTGGSSLTILFGPSLERSTSATYSASSSTSTTSAEVRALTAAAAAAALTGSHSRSFAGLVHSLSSMVAASSSPLDTTTTTTTDVSATASMVVSSAMASTLSPVPNFTSTSTVTASNGIGSSGHYGLLDHRTLFKETHAVQSITMSRSGQRALITIHKMGLHLWDVEACAIVQRFVGYKQDRYRLNPTFGGANEQFVSTGSENGRVHIWHTSGGNHPIHSTLAPSNGTRDAVTCVHWNPAVSTMIASVNDAGELCIWGPQRYTLGLGQPMEES